MRHLAFCAALVLLALPGGAAAGSLEDCEDLGASNELYLCASAAQFGADAAFIRHALMDRMTELRQGRKTAPGRAWFGLASGTVQRTVGNFEGAGTHLLLGADTPLSPALAAGAMVVAGESYIEPPFSARVDRREVLAGPYIAAELPGGSMLDAYLIYGTPDYTISNVTTRGSSLTGALTWSRVLETGGSTFVPFAALSLRREEPAAGSRIDAAIVTLGSSIEGEVVAAGAGFRQAFGRLELDVGHYSDSFGTEISYIAPRVGGGLRYAWPDGGALQLIANASAASDETVIMAAQLSYRIEF